MAIDNDVLKDHILDEIQKLRTELINGLSAVHARLDKQDLNHAAEYLREFGYFLERNPDFMTRQREREERLQEREIALHYLARVFHLTNWKSKMSWLMVGIATGFLFALGNALFAPFGGWYEGLHHFLVHMTS